MSDQDQANPVKFIGDKEASKKMIQLARQNQDINAPGPADLMAPVQDTKLDEHDLTLLDSILTKVQSGEINLLSPSSLLNSAVYEAKAEEQKGQIDTYAVNMISTVRRIKDMHDFKGVDETLSSQTESLLHEFRLKKEAIEKQFGDVFII